MAAERKTDKPISPEHVKFLLLNEAKQIGTLLNENPGKSTITILGKYTEKPFELPKLPFESKRNIIWSRLQGECGFTKEQAYEAVGIDKNSKITK